MVGLKKMERLEVKASDESMYGSEIARRLAVARKEAREQMRVFTDPLIKSKQLTGYDYMIRMTI